MGKFVHGMCGRIEYRCWKGMNQRCHNPSNPLYRYYGAKGIVVCEQWRRSFVQFLSDVGPRPSLEYSLDRFPNASGNYEPGNVRWATDTQQARNKPDYNVNIEWRGQIKTVGEWTAELGFSKDLLRQRLASGWDVEEAMTTAASPLVRPSKRIAHHNVNRHACGHYCVYSGSGKSRKYVGMTPTIEAGIRLRDEYECVPDPNEVPE